MLELGVVEDRWALSPRDPEAPAWQEAENRAWQARRMEVYAAQVDGMDRGIGRIVAALRETGLLDHTLTLFLADNGGCAESLYDPPALVRRFLPLAFRAPARDGEPVQRGNDPAVLPGGEHTFQSYGLAWAPSIRARTGDTHFARCAERAWLRFSRAVRASGVPSSGSTRAIARCAKGAGS
jgi:arylsulfatase